MHNMHSSVPKNHSTVQANRYNTFCLFFVSLESKTGLLKVLTPWWPEGSFFHYYHVSLFHFIIIIIKLGTVTYRSAGKLTTGLLVWCRRHKDVYRSLPRIITPNACQHSSRVQRIGHLESVTLLSEAEIPFWETSCCRLWYLWRRCTARQTILMWHDSVTLR